jgi:CBS domain-containing protein
MTMVAETQREMLSLVTARIRDTFVRKPLLRGRRARPGVGVPRAVARGPRMRWCATGKDGARLGIFTTTDLRDALLRDVPPQQLAVREVARFELIGVHADADLFEALWLMVRHRVHRLLVRDGGDTVAGRARPARPGELRRQPLAHRRAADRRRGDGGRTGPGRRAHRRDGGKLLHGSGIRIERITRLVSELNRACSRACGRCWRRRAGGQQLPAGDGQRRPRRADPQDRPGQRAAAARRLRYPGLAALAGASTPRWPSSATRPARATSC